ncbi:hypothetical protein P5673_006856 [Acropora cervicornis]|uniref:Carbohydrate-binding domain-containing protein n=1 Tax=Acropora cervicornis TaxID=6130 RepID=A0AAD9VBV8_ACRCE|nr:hypothetical protein P5673_006856 [Acropora cervicornis]
MWLIWVPVCFLLFFSILANCFPTDCVHPFPRSYVVYHLNELQEAIHVDGKLNDEAWNSVAWTEDFIDIQGPDWKKPRFRTHAKMLWDDAYLYIGAFLQETDVWANQTKHDSVVYQDNDFEVFVDPDGDTHWYPYINGGTPNSSWEMPTLKSAIFVSGPVNNASLPDKFWTVELALPFSDLVDHSPTASAPPNNKDQWRINFSRVEWHVRNVNGHYEKVPNVPEDNWVWSSQGAINMHLPERWGFIQFSTDAVNTTQFVRTRNWPAYSALVMLYEAEKKFIAVNGYYTANLTQLEIPASLKTGQCQYEPAVQVVKLYNFEATVKPLNQRIPVGHIRDDRFIWFTERDKHNEIEV